MAALNRDRAEKLEVGIALHLGEVVYRNIGAANRLDFTVIGAAVNEAARIQELCRSLGERILVSAGFSCGCASERLVSLGRHRLRGLEEPREIFTLPSGRPPRADGAGRKRVSETRATAPPAGQSPSSKKTTRLSRSRGASTTRSLNATDAPGSS